MELNITVGGQPPEHKTSHWGRWSDLRRQALDLNLVGVDSQWLHLSLRNAKEANRARRNIIAISQRRGKAQGWRFETRLVQEENGEMTLWLRKIALTQRRGLRD